MSEALPKNEPPLYQRVKDHIKQQIRAGVWSEGDRVPSERTLMAAFQASRMTVNRAVRELAAEGWLNRIQGAGTFVAGEKLQSVLLEIGSIRAEVEARGGRYRAQVLRLVEAPAEPWAVKAFQLEATQPLFHSVILHWEDGEPIQWEDRLVNPAFAPDYLAQDFTAVTPHDYLLQQGPIEAAEHRIDALMPDEEQRRGLRMEAGLPCLSLLRRTWSGGLVATRGRLLHPGGRFSFIGRQDYRSAGKQPGDTTRP
ncbi:MAG: histidine utilization repressor [Pseudomonadota bacterium]